MLVGISFGLPRQSRELKAEATKIETERKAEHGTVRASIHYFKRKEGNKEVDGLASLKSFQTEWKAKLEHYARFPYAAGMKILPAGVAEPFFKVNDEFEAKRPQVWTDWADDVYPDMRQTAPQRMGTLYDPNDFPSLKDCMERFRCEVTVVPLGEAEQVQRISSLSPDMAELIKSSTDKAMQKASEAAQQKNWEDVLKPIQKIVDTLSKDKAKIFDSLIGNVIEIVDLVPAINFQGDSKLTELASKAKEALATIKPDDLRKSKEARDATLATAKSIISSFTPFARKFA